MTTIAINPEIDLGLSASKERVDVTGYQVTFRQYPAPTGTSTNVTWNIQTPSMDVFMNRAIRVEYPVHIDFTGTVTGTITPKLLLSSGSDGLRSLAGLRILLNQTVSINGVAFPISANYYDAYSEILSHYSAVYRKHHPLGIPDTFGNYNFSTGATGTNPIGNYSSSSPMDGLVSRGAYAINFNFLTNTATSASVEFTLIDWIYVPQLMGLDFVNDLGFPRVRSLDINATLQLQDTYLWSHADGNSSTAAAAIRTSTITGFSARLTSAPQAIVKYISPPRELIPRDITRYSHLRLEKFSTQVAAQPMAGGAQATLVSNNIQLPNIPQFVWIWVRESDAIKNASAVSGIGLPDTYARIDNLQIGFNNQAGLLATATSQDLYQMSRDCGYMEDMNAFNGQVINSNFDITSAQGSLVCLQFGKHISLGSSDLSIGSAGMFNFYVSVTATNTNYSKAVGGAVSLGTTITQPTIYVVLGYNQDMLMGVGGEVSFVVPTTVGSVLGIGEGEGGVEQVPFTSMAMGGSWMGDINKWLRDKKVISKVGKVLAPMVGSVNPLVNTLANFAVKTAEEQGYGGRILPKVQLKQMIRKL